MWFDEYCTRGWIRFPFDRELLEWVARTLPIARGAVTAPEEADGKAAKFGRSNVANRSARLTP